MPVPDPASALAPPAAEAPSDAEIALPPAFLDPDVVPLSGRHRTELTVVPGVYFTPGMRAGEAAAGAPAGEGQGEGQGESSVTPRYTDVAILSRDELVAQEAEIAKSLAKLMDSNAEMLAFDPEEKDADLVEARAENVGAIGRAEERLEMMRRRLRLLDPTQHTNA